MIHNQSELYCPLSQIIVSVDQSLPPLSFAAAYFWSNIKSTASSYHAIYGPERLGRSDSVEHLSDALEGSRMFNLIMLK